MTNFNPYQSMMISVAKQQLKELRQIKALVSRIAPQNTKRNRKSKQQVELLFNEALGKEERR